jgi:selenocysteine lyase/cysteine desulfurase
MTPLSKQDFVDLDQLTWLYCGAESPVHRGAQAALEKYLHHRAKGPLGRAYNAEIELSCRQKFARLLNGRPEDIAFLSNASEAICAVLLALRLKPGENIVLHTLEYPSSVLASLALQSSGVEVRVIPHQQWRVETDELMAEVDENTRLVISSHVSYISGTRFDYETLYQRLQATQALLLLDATQAMGVVPVNMNHADFVISSSYKWLLGIHGGGVLAINSQRMGAMAPAMAGWRSVSDIFRPNRFETLEPYEDARRFEVGFPSFATLAVFDYTLSVLLEAGIDRIEKHVLELGGQLINELRTQGFTVMTPDNPVERAGNIAIVCAEGEEVSQSLAKQGILTWGGDGRLRMSIHGYNDEVDVQRVLQSLSEAGAG